MAGDTCNVYDSKGVIMIGTPPRDLDKRSVLKRVCNSGVVRGLTGFLLLIIIPYVHIGIIYSKLWVPDKKPVNRDNCTCSCWDTVFKGSYENGKRVSYKHMYFNATPQTFGMWVMTMAAVLSGYEVVKYILRLYSEGTLRISMLFLILINIHPHYYTWWGNVNYFNDDFYSQFVHQQFFSVTEVISTAVVLRMCSTKCRMTPPLLLTVFSINVVHILIGGLDQFFIQLILMNGRTSQRMRNLGFIIPDIFHLIIPYLEYRKSLRTSQSQLTTRKNIAIFLSSTICMFLLGKYVMK